MDRITKRTIRKKQNEVASYLRRWMATFLEMLSKKVTLLRLGYTIPDC
jgi:hypothetical protein